jgi:hypothetical protein
MVCTTLRAPRRRRTYAEATHGAIKTGRLAYPSRAPAKCAIFVSVGLVIPMLVGTVAAAANVVISLLISAETKGKALLAELQVA